MPDYSLALRAFLQNYQSDEALKQYRQFVNVYAPHEEDIAAIYSGDYELKNVELVPSAYGKGQMFQCMVGHTTFRIWDAAAAYIIEQSGGAIDPV